MIRIIVLVLILGGFYTSIADAHGFGGSGFLHPLTGVDHLVAMLAVGVWSAQIGGKAIYIVPSCFVLMMLLGGLVGLEGWLWSHLEVYIACSVCLLGLAIVWNRQQSVWIASCGVALFGFAHGYAHGLEIPLLLSPAVYITGFLITTIGLHVIGAVGGLLILEEPKGAIRLQGIGIVILIVGLKLIFF
ncbi:urease accessory protein [Paenibacillus sp. SORGH_AS306]|uniref:HupE/UreJ family protein n=1 Tax=unclassified Paenibacillus TaxID=185978 RepID=UPI0027887615|nr:MULTISPECIES: HupE/UreJ family protein [unclassified Paenibacillus]MDQ1236462.1 urease accessory protein [Paenibacillus sp. SORGH_AS_0306]MDR6108816.1 urease accessory protein [Paenibacillus sp. SORGH_AS_0338]